MTFSLATKSANGKCSSCRFPFSAVRNATTKATDTQLSPSGKF